MSCLLAMMIPTELVTFIAHAPTSETDDAFFSLSAFSISRFGFGSGSHRYQIQRELHQIWISIYLQNVGRRKKMMRSGGEGVTVSMVSSSSTDDDMCLSFDAFFLLFII
ncbi:hypothetical protein F2Q69_00061157 [Brassica cretica]|uniref:Uncharacterized protein n=1 Tax=Brassica cretica TaxID=69181 RepID=A0A8S9RCR7_BRACR|nr:hypothetical protein F2Q69_00061157 [Brassica cretica]